MNEWLERQFKLSERKTDVRTEVIAGITTFMTTEAPTRHTGPVRSRGTCRLYRQVQFGTGDLVVHSQGFVGGVHEGPSAGKLVPGQRSPVLEQGDQLNGAGDPHLPALPRRPKSLKLTLSMRKIQSSRKKVS